jgi:tetratricopeptide (TPR) repeat protein/predicted Ser/Thr protein kinase
MHNGLCADSGSRSAELPGSGDIRTDFAPPFRALSSPAVPGFVQVAGYEIIAELGRGGMGVVYQARQRSLGRLVAIKTILAGLHTDSSARLRFRTEAQAVARLQHANIVQIHEVGENDNRPFLVLEYVDGGNLLRKVAGTAQPEQFAARLVETLARAVHYMHECGILHRDLKPTNVLLSADGTPRITDFGLAKILDADAGLTRTETLLGTPSYMAPEQTTGDAGKVGRPADVYSLGAILYELLTGRAPFQGATPLSTLDQVRNQDPVPPRRLRRSVSLDLQTICLKCLEKEPGRRYATAEALADDLHHFLQGEPIQARPTPIGQRLWRSARRHAALVAWALAAVALISLLFTVWPYFRAADQLARHGAEEKYREFVRQRNEALFHGLIAADEGALFLGADTTTNLKAAESAARAALDLAGVDIEAESAAIAAGLPAARRSEVTTDCYTLLLVLAGIREHEPVPTGATKRRHEAVVLMDRARQFGFQTRAYHLRRAHVLERLGEQEEAKKERDRAASLPPQSALDHFLMGEEQYRRGHWELAMNSFNRALSVQSGHFWSQFFLAVCHLKVQQWEAARASFNACVSQQPDFVWAYLFRSFANEKLHALAEARADFQKGLELNPNNEARYVLFLSRGILHFNQNDLEQAAADFQSAMALKPEQYNAYLNLAQVYLARKQFDEATQQFETALHLRPPIAVVVGYHVERGRNLLRDHRYNEALQASEAALQLSADQPLAHEVCGRAMLALGHYHEAELSFDQYFRQRGEAKSDVFRSRGLARMKLGKYPEAVEDYTQALERAPDADIYQHRGWAHFFCDAWKLALRDFSAAIELDTDMSDAYTGRGLAHVMLGKYREAVTDAEAALLRKVDTPEMMHNIACIFAQAVARAEADVHEKDRQSLSNDYRERALQAVGRTLAMLRPEERAAFWRDKILPDAALVPIRNDAGFKRLHQEYLGTKGL